PMRAVRCPKCGQRRFDNPVGYQTMVSAAELPTSPPTFFAVSGDFGFDLIMPLARWRRLRGKRGTRGIPTRPVIVLPPSRATSRPRIQWQKEKPCWKHEKWQLNPA